MPKAKLKQNSVSSFCFHPNNDSFYREKRLCMFSFHQLLYNNNVDKSGSRTICLNGFSMLFNCKSYCLHFCVCTLMLTDMKVMHILLSVLYHFTSDSFIIYDVFYVLWKGMELQLTFYWSISLKSFLRSFSSFSQRNIGSTMRFRPIEKKTSKLCTITNEAGFFTCFKFHGLMKTPREVEAARAIFCCYNTNTQFQADPY